MIAVIHPGPVLRVYENGAPISVVDLTPEAAISLAADLMDAASVAIRDAKRHKTDDFTPLDM